MELREGQVAVVTGAASGIGRALARRFAAEGLSVVLGDVEEGPLAEAADELMEGGAQILARTVDVSEPGEVRAFADAAYDTFGAVHVLCNNAGVGSGAEGPMWEHEPNDWKRALAVNVRGVFHGVQAFVPRMLAGGEPGHVVNTSSGDGGLAPLPSASVHAVTTSAVVTMTESLYAHLRAEHARVGASVLLPGPGVSHGDRPERSAEEVAGYVVDGIRADRFWMLPASERGDRLIRERSRSMLDRANPSYLEGFGPDRPA